MLTKKIDGWFVYIDYDTDLGWQPVKSRAGRVIPAFEFLHYQLGDMLAIPDTNLRIIAEAHIGMTPFHVVNGIFNRSTGNYDATEVEFTIHDLVMEANITPAIDRFKCIPNILLPRQTRFSRAELLHVSSSQSLWDYTFNQVVDEGYEGIVLKQVDSIYNEGKRNSTLMKMKKNLTADLLAIQLEETIGEKGEDNVNLVLQSKDGVEITVRVGNFEERAGFLANPRSVIGKVVEIGAMEKLVDGTYREPVYKCIRGDKLQSEID